MDNKVVKYFAHDPGYDIAKEVKDALLYDSLKELRAVYTEIILDLGNFQYVRVTMEIVKQGEKCQ